MISKIQETVGEFFGPGQRDSDYDVLDGGVYKIAERAKTADFELSSATCWIRVVGEAFILAGYPAGDRGMTLLSVRKALAELSTARAALRKMIDYSAHDHCGAMSCEDKDCEGCALVKEAREALPKTEAK